MKSSKILILFLLAWGVLPFACKQNANQPDANTVPAPVVKPEVILYAATVDKLNLRDQPNKNGQVLAQLTEGELVEGTGEVSANKEEATLRGMTYLEPYHKVATLSPEPKTGWAFGGGLLRLYAGSRAGIPHLDQLRQLTGLLKTLDAKNLESGKKAWDEVSARFGSANGALADAAFILLEQFLFRMEREGEYYTLTEKIKWEDADFQAIANRTFDMNKNQVAKSLAENGFELAEGEGMVFPVVDWNRLQTFFGPKVTRPMKFYLDQQVAERNKRAWDDGGIVIPMEELADRATFWEQFNRENPYFALNEQTKESERWTRLVLVNGSDNTPVFNYENQEITEAYKNVWAYVQQKYPGTTLAKTTKEIADLCAAEGWKRTKKVEEWQAKYAESEY